MPDFWINILSNTITTVIGVILGIPAAFWINRQVETRQEARQKAKEKIQSQGLALCVLISLKDEIAKNRDILHKLIEELPKRVIYYNLSTSAWASITDKMMSTVDHYELLQSIASLYSDYEQMKQQVMAQFSMHYSVLVALDNYLEVRGGLVDPTVEFAKDLVVKSDSLLSSIMVEMEHLRLVKL